MVHQRLDAFELQILESPAPTIDLTILQEVVASLRADMDIILEMKEPEPATAPVETTEDIVLAALFTAPIAPPHEPRGRVKQHHSSRTLRDMRHILERRSRQILKLRGQPLWLMRRPVR